MKILFTFIWLIVSPALIHAQLGRLDSLQMDFATAPDGNLKYTASNNLYYYYQEVNRDSALFYTEQQLSTARRNKNKIAEGVALVNQSYQLMGLGRYADALKCLRQSFVIAEDKKNEKGESWKYFLTPFDGNNRLLLLSYTHHMYALLMLQTGNLEQQIIHFKIAGRIGKEINYVPRIMLAYLNLGQSYLTKNDLDSALYFEKEAEQTGLNADVKTFSLAKVYLGTVQQQLGDIYKARKNGSLSLGYYYKSIQTCTQYNNRVSLSRVLLRLSKYHLEKGNRDSALYYSLMNIENLKTLGKVTGPETNLGTGYEQLYLSYRLNDRFDSAFKYQGLALVTKDSLNKIRIKDLTEFQNASFQEVIRLQDLEKEKTVYESKIRTYVLLGGLAVFLLIVLILYRNNKQKQKTNKVLERTLTDLRSTQTQLIQSEKMASLGELTAGIAHEIQNPLNFVNNFSEVNTELIDELQEHLATGNLQQAKETANDIKANEAKINHHGKRADSIVKGMLQHSRNSSGQKELTDINVLVDECLRLSYHGLRAKDKSFNAKTETDLDNSIPRISIVPQEIGRVILNLFTNAFYAVMQKKKQLGEAFDPIVIAKTIRTSKGISISIRDNGNGVPPKVIDKIFQPFFTTKPVGEGTGLGLSMSYEIITKGHGGELMVQTKEGEYAEFIINLPI